MNADEQQAHYNNEYLEAVLSGETNKVREALAMGADPAYVTAPVLRAVIHNNLPMVNLLLDHGCSIDESFAICSPPLTTAVEKGYADIALCLIERGAKTPGDGYILTVALELSQKRCAVIEALVNKAGAEINAPETSNTSTPILTIAVMNGDLEAVDCLLKLGADPEIPGRNSKQTALHFACQSNTPDGPAIVERLLAAGANPLAERAGGDRPLDVAMKCGLSRHAEIVKKYLHERHEREMKVKMASQIEQLNKMPGARPRRGFGGA